MSFPAESPVPVQLHFIVFFDRRLLAVRSDPRLLVALLQFDLKPIARFARVTVANPDVIFACGRNFDLARGDGLIIVSAAGDRQEPAFTSLIPLGGPTWS